MTTNFLQFNMGGSDTRLDASLAQASLPADVLLLQETSRLAALELQGWTIARSQSLTALGEHRTKHHAYAAVAVCSELRSRTKAFTTRSNLVAGLLLEGHDSLPDTAFFSAYLPPRGAFPARKTALDKMLADLAAMLLECKDSTAVIIGGDFNMPYGPWAPSYEYRETEQLAEALLDWMSDHDLDLFSPPGMTTCLAAHSRHEGGTVIDLTFSSILLSDFATHDWPGRHDHFAITFRCPADLLEAPRVDPVPFRMTHVNWDRFSSTFHRLLRADGANTPAADKWLSLLSCLQTALDLSRHSSANSTEDSGSGRSSKRRRRSETRSWAWTNDCAEAAAARNTVEHHLRSTLPRPDPGVSRKRQISNHARFREADAIFKAAVKEAKRRAMEQLLGDLQTTAEWGKVAILSGRRRRHTPFISPNFLDAQGQVASSAREKCVLLANEHFPHHLGALPPANPQALPAAPTAGTGLCSVTPGELASVLHDTLPGKAPGANQLTADVLKQAFNSSPTFQAALLEVVDLCLTQAVFPSDWKHAEVLMIPKPGRKDPRRAASYRPISLLCVVGKVSESIVKTRLLWELEHKALSHQFALGHGASAIQAVSVLLQKGRDALARHKKVALLTIDVRGAFNQIDHQRLLHILSSEPLNLHSYAAWVAEWLRSRSVTIRFEKASLGPLLLGDRGVPQGSPLSPLLWCLYLDSFFQSLGSNFDDDGATGAYMDDVFLLVTADSDRALRQKAQAWLDALFDWCAARSLSLDKPSYLLCTGNWNHHGPPVSDIDMTLTLQDGSALAPTNGPIRVLGVDISGKLNLYDHIRRKCAEVELAASQLHVTMREAGPAPLLVRLKIAKALLLPRLDYGGSLHPAIRTDDLPKVHRAERAIYAFVLGQRVGKSFPSGPALAHELGQLRTETRWRKHALALLAKLQLHTGHSGAALARTIVDQVAASYAAGNPSCGDIATFGPGDLCSVHEAKVGVGAASSRKAILAALTNAHRLGPMRLAARSLPFSPLESLPASRSAPWEWDPLRIQILDRERATKSERLKSGSTMKGLACVYTDGSFTEATGRKGSVPKLGAGAILRSRHPSMVKESRVRLDGTRFGIFEAELTAILAGLQLAIPAPDSRSWRELHLFSDSQAALQRLGCSWRHDSRSMQSLTAEIRTTVRTLETQHRTRVFFWWIPSHSDIAGNEQADALAAEAADLPLPASPPPPFSLSKALSWVTAKATSIEQATWPHRASGSLLQVSPSFSFDNLRTYVGLTWRLCWLLTRFRSGTLATADHRPAQQDGNTSRCQCGAQWQDRQHLLLACPLAAEERTRLRCHFPSQQRGDLSALLCGGAFPEEDSRPAYLNDLRVFLNKCNQILVETCREVGVFDRGDAHLPDLRTADLTFADSGEAVALAPRQDLAALPASSSAQPSLSAFFRPRPPCAADAGLAQQQALSGPSRLPLSSARVPAPSASASAVPCPPAEIIDLVSDDDDEDPLPVPASELLASATADLVCDDPEDLIGAIVISSDEDSQEIIFTGFAN